MEYKKNTGNQTRSLLIPYLSESKGHAAELTGGGRLGPLRFDYWYNGRDTYRCRGHLVLIAAFQAGVWTPPDDTVN